MSFNRWQFLSRSALAIPARWQLMILALAIATLACAGPGWSPTQAPEIVPIQTETQIPAGPTAPADQAPETDKAIVSAMRALNVRKGMSEKTEGIGVLLAGEAVDLTGMCTPEGWAQIRYKLEGKTVLAWVNGRYLSGDQCEEER